jgi:hypothetical protein
MNTVKIAKSDVPSCLVDSHFYQNYVSELDDDEEIEVRQKYFIENIKTTYNCVNDFKYMLEACQFWGFNDIPDYLIDFCLNLTDKQLKTKLASLDDEYHKCSVLKPLFIVLKYEHSNFHRLYFQALKYDNVRLLKYIFKNGDDSVFDADKKYHNVKTSIAVMGIGACVNSCLEILKYTVKQGYKVTYRDFIQALKGNNTEFIKYIYNSLDIYRRNRDTFVKVEKNKLVNWECEKAIIQNDNLELFVLFGFTDQPKFLESFMRFTKYIPLEITKFIHQSKFVTSLNSEQKNEWIIFLLDKNILFEIVRKDEFNFTNEIVFAQCSKIIEAQKDKFGLYIKPSWEINKFKMLFECNKMTQEQINTLFQKAFSVTAFKSEFTTYLLDKVNVDAMFNGTVINNGFKTFTIDFQYPNQVADVLEKESLYFLDVIFFMHCRNYKMFSYETYPLVTKMIEMGFSFQMDYCFGIAKKYKCSHLIEFLTSVDNTYTNIYNSFVNKAIRAVKRQFAK